MAGAWWAVVGCGGAVRGGLEIQRVLKKVSDVVSAGQGVGGV